MTAFTAWLQSVPDEQPKYAGDFSLTTWTSFDFPAWLQDVPADDVRYIEGNFHLTTWTSFPFDGVPAEAGAAGSSSVSINDGADVTHDNDVVLSLSSQLGGSPPSEMRFREGGGPWTELEPYTTEKDWKLAPASSASEERTITAEFAK